MEKRVQRIVRRPGLRRILTVEVLWSLSQATVIITESKDECRHQ
jgi:hypothetical protein